MSAFFTSVVKASAAKTSIASQATHFLLGISALMLFAPMAMAAPADARGSSVQAGLIADGTYAYGETQKRDQRGQTYFVFEVKQGKVLGAFYTPRSSYDCTYGQVTGTELALKVVDSYDRTSHAYDVALDRTSTVAANGGLQTQISLKGFKKLDKVMQSDRDMLKSCKATAIR
jgi:hypothetical protein